jgi:hypothetical protein
MPKSDPPTSSRAARSTRSAKQKERVRPGKVRWDGSRVCVRHAELLGLENQSETILGEVFDMDQWLESVDGRTDESRVGRAEHHRNDLVEQIRSNRTRIELIHDELLKDHEGTT